MVRYLYFYIKLFIYNKSLTVVALFENV